MKNKQITFTVYGVNFTSEPTDLATARCAVALLNSAVALLNSLTVPGVQIVDMPEAQAQQQQQQ